MIRTALLAAALALALALAACSSGSDSSSTTMLEGSDDASSGGANSAPSEDAEEPQTAPQTTTTIIKSHDESYIVKVSGSSTSTVSTQELFEQVTQNPLKGTCPKEPLSDWTCVHSGPWLIFTKGEIGDGPTLYLKPSP